RPAPSPADGERREGGPQRSVPLRLRQEVQEVLLSQTGRLRNVAHRSGRTPVHDPDPQRRAPTPRPMGSGEPPAPTAGTFPLGARTRPCSKKFMRLEAIALHGFK